MIERVLACGCSAVIDDDEIHVYPCGPGHYEDILAAARELADEHGITTEVAL